MKSHHHTYRNNIFQVEGVSLATIAGRVGTPFYVYSRAEIEDSYRAYDLAFKEIPHLVCFALKANANLAIGRVLSRLGAGADIVSSGEMVRALKAGFRPGTIIFSGVGKTQDELRLAITKGIRLI